MSETFEEYVARILGYVEGKNTRRILRSTPQRLEKRISKAPSRKLMKPPAPGKWSIAQILGHLAETEMLWGYRIRMILEKDGVELLGMDQDTWVRNSRLDRVPAKRSLATFTAIRAANLNLFDILTPAQMRRHGSHTQFGQLTISKIESLIAGHDINHSRQITSILAKK